MTQVRDLAGKHLGKTITIATEHTTATGVLQGVECISRVLTYPQLNGLVEYVFGKTETTITLLPGQTIIARLTDEVIVKGLEIE
jgi:hypothetical protein